MATVDTSTGYRLLVVDDDTALSAILTWDFQELGYDVTAAQSCRAAEQAMAERRFDVALVDHNLPDGLGLALIPRLRRVQPETVFIMFSADDNPELGNQARQLGAERFLLKPVNTAQIDRMFRGSPATGQAMIHPRFAKNSDRDFGPDRSCHR